MSHLLLFSCILALKHALLSTRERNADFYFTLHHMRFLLTWNTGLLDCIMVVVNHCSVMTNVTWGSHSTWLCNWMSVMSDSFCHRHFLCLWNPPSLGSVLYHSPLLFPFLLSVSHRDPGSGPGSVNSFYSLPRKVSSSSSPCPLLVSGSTLQLGNRKQQIFFNISIFSFRQKIRDHFESCGWSFSILYLKQCK